VIRVLWGPGWTRFAVIDRRYALDEVVEATRYVETGQKTGNVVLLVSEAAAGEQPEPDAKQASFAKRSS
jgi:hypothetical protein